MSQLHDIHHEPSLGEELAHNKLNKLNMRAAQRSRVVGALLMVLGVGYMLYLLVLQQSHAWSLLISAVTAVAGLFLFAMSQKNYSQLKH